MNIIEVQTEILTKLSQIIHDESDSLYQEASCQFTYMPDYDVVKLYFEFRKNNQSVNRGISSENTERACDLAEELRDIMKSHTGGEWTSFTLTLDAVGQAKSKFQYPEKT